MEFDYLEIYKQYVQPALPVIFAIVSGYIIFWTARYLVARIGRGSRRISAFLVDDDAHPVGFGSHEHRLRLLFAGLGITINGHEESALWAGRAMLGVIAFLVLNALFGLPIWISVLGFAAGWVLMGGMVENAWSKQKVALEEEIPFFLSGFSATIKVTSNLLQAVEEELGGLLEGSPLRLWLTTRFVREGNTRGIEAIPDLVNEAFSISSSLGTMIFLLCRLWITGGEKWETAFGLASDNMDNILDARSETLSAGEGQKGTARMLALLCAAGLLILVRNPAVSGAMSMPIVQIAYAGMLIWMVFGWVRINKIIDSAL